VKVKSRDNTFDCWDAEDIAQEIRIICLHALDKFKPEKAECPEKIKNYFGRCVDNRLKNLRRDRYIRFSPPISKDKVRELEENPDSNPEEYAKLQRFRKDLDIKKKIKHPANIESIGDSNGVGPGNSEELVIARDLGHYLIKNIDVKLRPSLIVLLNGDKKKVNIRIRRRIQASIRTILEE